MKDVICEETARLCLHAYRDRLRALVLTGSLARNEGTFVKDSLGCLLLGDAEFLLVLDDRATLPSDADLRVIEQQIQAYVCQRGLRAEITLTAVRPKYLRQLPPSIFAYELRNCGETVAGHRETLSLIPDFSRTAIPLEDAWRLLSNRLVEQLEGARELLEGRLILSPKLHYRTVKLYLDMATSFLVFEGAYAPTYQQRARNLAVLVEPPPGTRPWPFRLRPFVDDVAACTEWKLAPSEPGLDAGRTFWERAVDYARALCRWELERLQGPDPNASPEALMMRWVRSQPVRARVRGWVHVVRQCGWHRSSRHWARWLRQAMHASPRRLVYATGSLLLFELTAAPESRLVLDLEHLRRNLPVPSWPGQNGHHSSLGSLAQSIVQNYKTFVAETRA